MLRPFCEVFAEGGIESRLEISFISKVEIFVGHSQYHLR